MPDLVSSALQAVMGKPYHHSHLPSDEQPEHQVVFRRMVNQREPEGISGDETNLVQQCGTRPSQCMELSWGTRAAGVPLGVKITVGADRAEVCLT